MFGVALAISKAHVRLSENCNNSVLPRIFKQCFCEERLHLRQSVRRIQTFSNCRSNVPNNKTWSGKVRFNIFQSFRNKTTNPLEVNTKVANNVLLYKYERPYLYKGALIFGIAALIGCCTMADNVYLLLVKDLFNNEIDLKERLKNNAFQLLTITIGLIAGPIIIAVVWYITKRSVKYIVLHKGGQIVTFVLYHPLKGETKLTVPASLISCKAGRADKKGYIPIKLRDQKYHYIIDKEGQFINPELFDTVIAARRFT